MNDRRMYQVLVLAGLTLMFIALCVVMLWVTRGLWSPTAAGLLVAYICFPVMKWMSKIGMPRWLTLTGIMASLGLMLVLILHFILPFVSEEISRLRDRQNKPLPKIEIPDPDAAPNANLPSAAQDSVVLRVVQQLSGLLKEWNMIDETWDLEKTRRQVNNWMVSQSSELLNFVSDKAIRMFNFLMIFFFVLIFALLDGDRFYQALVRMLPNSFFEAGVFVLNETTKMFGNYLRGVAIETVILGAICFALLLPLYILIKPLVLGVILVISLIISLTNVVRIVGPIFGGLVGCIIAFTTTSDLRAAFGALVVALIVQFLDNVLVLPLVMEDQMQIHPVMCLLGVLAGGIIGGVLGMALAIPFMGGIKVVLRVFSVEMRKFNYDSEPYYVYDASAQR